MNCCAAPLVYGQVTLYGEVCRHEMGYRAEHARVDRLFLRAGGRHAAAPVQHTGLLLLDLLEMRPSPYCACDELAAQEWFTFEELEVLTRQLGDRHQCDVTIDSERGRVPSYLCFHARRTRNTHARRA